MCTSRQHDWSTATADDWLRNWQVKGGVRDASRGGLERTRPGLPCRSCCALDVSTIFIESERAHNCRPRKALLVPALCYRPLSSLVNTFVALGTPDESVLVTLAFRSLARHCCPGNATDGTYRTQAVKVVACAPPLVLSSSPSMASEVSLSSQRCVSRAGGQGKVVVDDEYPSPRVFPKLANEVLRTLRRPERGDPGQA